MESRNFVTLWLRKDDDEKDVSRYGEIMREVVDTHCGGIIGNVRLASGGRRITVTTPCKSQACSKPINTMSKITEEITKRTNRKAKGIASCGKS